jgi:predicted RNase H-like HicB family nuclease
MSLFSLPIAIEPTETGGYLATSPILPGFLVEGETIEEVYREAPIVARALLDTYQQMGKPIPVIPHHTREISKKTLNKILKELGLKSEDLQG